MAGIPPELVHSTRICLRLRPRPVAQIRNFTTTPTRQKHGPLPTFAPTSSPELDALLATFRTNVFLPSHLLRGQQNLVYKKSLQHHLLGEDPVKVELPISTSPTAKETFTLVPLDRFTDEPNSRASFNKMVDLMRTENDWEALPGLLQGLKGSRRKVKRDAVERMVRKAVLAGRIATVIEVLRQTKRTGVRVDDVAVARGVMRGALETAIQSGWSEEGVTKAAKQAGVIMELIEDPAHLPTRKEDREAGDPRRAPDVVGLAMTLMAFKVLKVGEGEEKRDVLKMERYAKRVLSLWTNADFHLTEPQGPSWSRANEMLVVWAPVAQGMRWTIRALGEQTETAQKMEKVLRGDVEPVLGKSKRTMEELASNPEERMGVMMLKEMERAVV